MKLYTGHAPNPRRVSIYLAEKGIELPRVELNIFEGEARTPELLAKNALGALPILELDDGERITESHAICAYLESLHPAPPLFGSSALERARVEMWSRRIEFELFLRVAATGRHTIPFFETRCIQVPAYADAQRRELPAVFAWLDRELADGRRFLAGAFSVADITAMITLRLCEALELKPDPAHHNLARYEAELRARPTWNL